ncbi:MAG: SDR family oxidoreductase [Proteobacteria bacterium]|nr:SDR family oxidoreductase [Pseudomonadota bacterium]
MLSKVKGRVALVAGATDEVGEAIALRLAADGAKIALCDQDAQKLAAVAAKITGAGGEAATFVVKLSDAQAVHGCVEQIVARYSRIDILVNNPAETEGKGLNDLSAESFNATVAASLGAEFNFLREVVPLMQKNSCGRVVNISNLAYLGIPRNADLAAAKSGLFGLTRSIALEMARSNVTVNCVVKGDIPAAEVAEEVKAKIAGGIPVKRVGTPSDVSYAVSFFASDTSDYVTGQTFFVCGGKSNYFSMSV